ncbi:fimbrial protein StiA [Leminorella richardii]|uniref:Fimbrial protein StiA n=2 Tax=Leminorella richardii TaxID=158841 RepID=A0A2X4V440_9GAMM|nr:fimbrial protein StiA [Leminorella richardii]
MNITARLLSPQKRSLRLLGGLLFSTFALTTMQSQAASCEPFTPTYYEDFSVPVIGPDIATIGEDIAVGAVIYSGRYNFAVANEKRIGWRCKVEEADLPATFDTYMKADVIAMPSGAPTFFGNKAVYPTNVPGIGVAINVWSAGQNTWKYPDSWFQGSVPITYASTIQNFGYMNSIGVELIKTGPIAAAGTQQVLSASFPTIQLSVGAVAPALFEKPYMTINFNGVMTMHTKTCQLATPVVDVELGTHQGADFTGVGSGTEWKDFEIVLKDCPPFYGYSTSDGSGYGYNYTERTGLTTGRTKANSVSATFNSVHGTYNARTALLESGPDSAEGIGIEVARRGEYTYNINLNGLSSAGFLNLGTDDGATYTLPLRARYVQYASSIKGGKANGALVFTITYL